MILYIFLIFLFGLAAFVCFCICVYSLIKKKNSTLKKAATAFVVSIIATIGFSYLSAKKTLEYAKSDEFQKDLKEYSKKAGETVGSVASGAAEGLNNGLDDEAITKLAAKSANILNQSIKAFVKNADTTYGKRNIFIDESIANTGIELGSVNDHYSVKANEIAFNISYSKDFKGVLKLSNYDQEGKLIESTNKQINAKANSNSVEKFEFKNTDLGICTYFILGK